MMLRISVRRSRATLRSAALLAALGLAAEHAGALSINQWTGSGTDVYNNANNWGLGRIPNSGDQATLYSGDLTLYGTPTSPGGMLISSIFGAGEFNTGSYKITVAGNINVDDGGNFYVFDASSAGGGTVVSAANLTVTQNSIYHNAYPGAHTEISGNTSVDATSQLWVESTFNDNSGANGTITINGTLIAYGGTINADNFILSGGSNTTASINVNGNNLTINSPNFSLSNLSTSIDASAFASHLTLNNTGSNLTLVNANVTLGDSAHLSLPNAGTWIFGNIFLGITAGSVNLNGGNTTARAATVDQYAYYDSLVNVTGFANMVAGEFDGGSVTTIASGGTLTVGSPYFRGVTHAGLFGNATYTTVSITGNGTMNWNGNTGIGLSNPNVPASIVNVANTTILNWEGTSGANATLDVQNGELDVFSTSIQPRLFKIGMFFITVNGYDGNMTIEGGSTLNVANASWDLFGTMTLGPGAVVQGQTIFINGTSLPAGAFSVNPSYSGTTFPSIQAPVVLQANSTIFLGFTGGLHMDGATTYAGGSVGSAPYVMSPYGIFVQNGNATVTGNTTIFCNTFDMDGGANTTTWTINAGATLTQEAWYLNPGDLTANAFHSTINLSGTLDVETHSGQWTLAGGTINIMGTGSAIIQHDKLILGSGSTIGTINVASGATGFVVGGLESAATTVAGGNIVNLNGYLVVQNSLIFDANSVLTETGPFAFEIETTPTCGVGSVFNVNNGSAQFEFGIPGPANLNVNVSGPGILGLYDASNLNSLHIQAGGSAIVSVGGTHTLFMNSFQLDGGATPTGSLGITDNKVIIQTTPATKATSLATLRAQVIYGYTHPLTAGIYDYYLPANYGVAVIDNALLGRATFGGDSANANSILISQELLGDANIDGKVDLSDLSTILNNFGATTADWMSGNFDGAATIDLTDLSDVLNNFGASNPKAFAAAGGTAAAPEPASLAALVLAGSMLLRRRKR